MNRVKKVLIGSLLAALALTVLGVVLFAVWRVRLANDVARQLAAIRAAGLPASGEEANRYYAEVPDEENAAVKMAEAFELMRTYGDRRSNQVARIRLPLRKDSLSAEQLDLLAGYCAMNSNALAQAAMAVQSTDGRYLVDLSWGAATPLPHLRLLKELGLLAEYQSRLDPRESVAEVLTILGEARTLDDEPVLISKMVRFALIGIASQTLEYRLNQGPFEEAELTRLSESFLKVDKTNQIANALIGERAMNIRYFQMSFAEIRQYADQDGDNSSAPVGSAIPGRQPFIFKFSGFFERDLRFYLQSMQTNIWLSEHRPNDLALFAKVQERTEAEARHKLFIGSSLFLPAAGNACARQTRSSAQIRTAQAALAIERFRLATERLPAQLGDLVPQYLSTVPADPFDGKPLRYHRLEKGYVVYSVGPDGEDNGGRERPANAKSSDKTHYDIPFTVER